MITLKNILKSGAKIALIAGLAVSLYGCKDKKVSCGPNLGINNSVPSYSCTLRDFTPTENPDQPEDITPGVIITPYDPIDPTSDTPIDPIDPENLAPTITSEPSVLEINEGGTLEDWILANDPEGHALDYSLKNGPAWLSVDAETGRISGTASEVTTDTEYQIDLEFSDRFHTVPHSYTLIVKNVPEIIPNQKPTITIEKDFGVTGLSGLVGYSMHANDPDGLVEKITVNPNCEGGTPVEYLNQDSSSDQDLSGTVPIAEGANCFTAIAYDDEDMSSDAVTVNFNSSDEPTTRTLIEGILDERKANGDFQDYVKDFVFNKICDGVWRNGIRVDYKIVTNGGFVRFINYGSSIDDALIELEDKNHLDKCNPNASLYMRLLPDTEVESRLNDFIENNVKPL